MMKSPSNWIFILLLLFGTKFASASGVMNLHGKIVGYTSTEVTLEVRKKLLYIIDRNKLADPNSKDIVANGKEITLMVPMAAVKSVKDIKTVK